MHENPTGACFIIASKTYSTKKIYKSASNVFKLVWTQIESVYENAKLLSNYSKFWVLQNADPFNQSLNNIH